jgi:hypothetical protein
MYLEELNKLKIQRQLGNYSDKINTISKKRKKDCIIGSFIGAVCGDILGLNDEKNQFCK